jgi:hypothetical protein
MAIHIQVGTVIDRLRRRDQRRLLEEGFTVQMLGRGRFLVVLSEPETAGIPVWQQVTTLFPPYGVEWRSRLHFRCHFGAGLVFCASNGNPLPFNEKGGGLKTTNRKVVSIGLTGNGSEIQILMHRRARPRKRLTVHTEPLYVGDPYDLPSSLSKFYTPVQELSSQPDSMICYGAETQGFPCRRSQKILPK